MAIDMHDCSPPPAAPSRELCTLEATHATAPTTSPQKLPGCAAASSRDAGAPCGVPAHWSRTDDMQLLKDAWLVRSRAAPAESAQHGWAW